MMIDKYDDIVEKQVMTAPQSTKGLFQSKITFVRTVGSFSIILTNHLSKHHRKSFDKLHHRFINPEISQNGDFSNSNRRYVMAHSTYVRDVRKKARFRFQSVRNVPRTTQNIMLGKLNALVCCKLLFLWYSAMFE